METMEATSQAVPGQYRMKKGLIVTVSVLLFLAVAAVAYVLCTFQIKYSSQEILHNQREIQQAWVDKTLESMRVWRNNVVEQSRFISISETFRLFAVDLRNLDAAARARLTAPDAAESDDENVVSMAEQLQYMRAILQDFAQRRSLSAARMVALDGETLVAPLEGAALTPEQKALVGRAATAKALVFGSVYRQGQALVMDTVDPLYEVLGMGDSKMVGFLLLTVPVDDALTAFLAPRMDQTQDFSPRILTRGPQDAQALFVQDGKAQLTSTQVEANADLSLPFKRRAAVAGEGEVYSLGSPLTDLDWCVVLEVSAKSVDGLVESQVRQIYGLGVLGSAGVGLLLAFIWASMASRSHKATARHFQHLYTLIRQQKLMLDSINASLQAGLLLANSEGRVQVCNPAFCQIAAKSEAELTGASIAEILPGKAAVALRDGMHKVGSSGVMDSVEISLEHPDETRLFRVTLFPFEDAGQDDGQRSPGGCVGIFQDITEFRRRAEAARERQANSISALVRAIESVDVNLIGHSRKMERVVDILTAAMNMEDKDRETLRLAARLSQVGKIFVPRDLLTKKEKLSAAEQQEVMRAPEYAYKVLHDLQFGLPVPEAVYQMGERLDGTGQPRQLQGEEIVSNARILAVVNAFCAMVSDRSYRAGLPLVEAVKLLAKDPGFDPTVVQALADLPLDAVRNAIGVKNDDEDQAKAEASAE